MSISYRAQPVRIKLARGQYFFEENGTRTLDCINNVSHIGHCHPYYVSRMQKQMNTLVTNSRFIYDELMEATHKILAKFPP
jgi:ethanolamine-phosphate phospho-lyase